MKTGTRVTTIVVLLAAAAVGAWFWQQRSTANGATKPAGPPPVRAVPVTVAPVQQRDVPLRLNLVGRTEAMATVTLRSRIDGQILEVHYKAGQHVKRGQKMVTLDARAILAQVQQGEANVARDRAQLVKAQADLTRYTDLVAKGFVSSAQLDVYRAAVDSLAATVKADQAQLDLTRVQLSYTVVTAPMDGVAGAVLVFPGGSVKANDSPLVIINQLKPINVSFAVPEGRLTDFGVERGKLSMKVEVKVPEATGAAMSGELTFVDNAVDPTTGTIIMKSQLANPDERLTPGQFVEVSILLKNLPGALVIPSEALQTGPDGTFVFVAKADGTVEIRKVQTTSTDGPELIVAQGLTAGERVVTDGQLRLTPGVRYEARTPGQGPPGARGADKDANKGEKGARGADGAGPPKTREAGPPKVDP